MNGHFPVEIEAQLLVDARRDALVRERFMMVREREQLIIRHRVQKQLEAPAETLTEIVKAMERCETALKVIDEIAAQWSIDTAKT